VLAIGNGTRTGADDELDRAEATDGDAAALGKTRSGPDSRQPVEQTARSTTRQVFLFLRVWVPDWRRDSRSLKTARAGLAGSPVPWPLMMIVS
jgi:hypothetical protein